MIKDINNETLGVITQGDSIGEEQILFFIINDPTKIYVSEGKSCVLKLEIHNIKSWLLNAGLKQDYMLLISYLQKSFNKKQMWYNEN